MYFVETNITKCFIKIEFSNNHIFLLKMELPEDVIQIIREYSRPMTRPDWRFIHKMTYIQLLRDYHTEYKKREYKMRMYYTIYIERGIIYKNIFSEHNYCRIMYYG